MGQVRILTDEDVYGAVAPALRNGGIDAVSTPETGRRAESDESRVIVTFNVGHFVSLHTAWIEQRRRHAGIAVSSQRPIGDLLRRILHLANTLKAEEMRDRLEFLSDW